MESIDSQTSIAAVKSHYPTVLIIEDDKLQQKLYKLIAEQVHMNPVLVSSCEDAIRVSAASNFDLIFMDLQMPDSDGLQCAEKLRQCPRVALNKTPIIAVTAHAMPGDRERCLDSGMDDYLSKPFTLDDLRHTIVKWTNTRN